MKSVSLLALLLLTTGALGSVVSGESARANPRPLAFTYPYATTATGQMEVEQYLDIVPIDVTDAAGETSTRLRFDLQTELGIGL